LTRRRKPFGLDVVVRQFRRVIETASRVRLAFAAACPEADLFRSMPAALMPAGP
jgi:hypothetical protein